jgi:hypothetical protein
LEESSAFAWHFYKMNATMFVRDFGLMPGLVAELGYEDSDRRIFLAKLDLIHRFMAEIAAKRRAAGGTDG